jgi:flagellar hook-basal body complex protein FliE
MKAENIGLFNLNNVQNQTKKATSPAQFQQEFGKLLNDAIEKVNGSQVESNKMTEALMNGEIDNLHQVMVTAEKASITLQTAVEVRNKVIEAYQEVMRMQV